MAFIKNCHFKVKFFDLIIMVSGYMVFRKTFVKEEVFFELGKMAICIVERSFLICSSYYQSVFSCDFIRNKYNFINYF